MIQTYIVHYKGKHKLTLIPSKSCIKGYNYMIFVKIEDWLVVHKLSTCIYCMVRKHIGNGKDLVYDGISLCVNNETWRLHK